MHYYQWLTNQEGQPISNASIYVYLAGGTNAVTLYTSDSGPTTISDVPQLTTTELGYFEFWIGDANDDHWHSREQKFKIKWIRSGVEEGFIDYVSIVDTDIRECSETDTGTTGDSIYKNKLVSNYLVKKWNDALESVVNSSIKSADYTITDTDSMETLFLSGAINITLPDVTSKRVIKFAKYDSGTISTITPELTGSTIYGNATVSLSAQYDTLTLETDGVDAWYNF